MKDWFPFTNYEFYAYLAAGVVVIAAVDYSFTGAVLVDRTDWTLVQGVFWTIVAYLCGQLTAAPSSALLEHFLARTVFTAPVEVASGVAPQRFSDRAIAWLFANREYRPLPVGICDKIRLKVSTQLNVSLASVSGETIFNVAFPTVRASADAAARLDQFLNLYGFCRNISFSALVALVCLVFRRSHLDDPNAHWLIAAAAVLCVGMYGRFIKFYAAYSREVLRADAAAS
jgi:hypothetical protein